MKTPSRRAPRMSRRSALGTAGVQSPPADCAPPPVEVCPHVLSFQDSCPQFFWTWVHAVGPLAPLRSWDFLGGVPGGAW
jgi:hypothetical protein